MFSKTKIAAVLIALTAAFSVATVGVASATTPTTTQTVKGTILQNAQPVGGVPVKVTCNGKEHALTSVGSGSKLGTYSTTFSSNVCPIGDQVTVTSAHGTASGTTNILLAAGTNTADVNLIVVAVPEFVPVTIGVAALIGGGVAWQMRRRTIARA